MLNEVYGKPYMGILKMFKVSNFNNLLFYIGSWLSDLTK